MESKSFVYWLQGYFEISQTNQGLSPEQVQIIKNHLNLVFKHEIDPSMGGPDHQKELNKIHGKNISPGSASTPPTVSHMVGGDVLIRC